MKLSETQKSVLTAIVEQTIKLRGKNAGDIKARISSDVFYYNTLAALTRRGLVDWKESAIHGDGLAATKAGYEVYKSL